MYDIYLSYLVQPIFILPRYFLQLVLIYPYKLSYPVLHVQRKMGSSRRTRVGALTGVTGNSTHPLLKVCIEYYSPTLYCPSREKGVL